MNNGWPMALLRDIAKPVSRSVPVEPGREYRTIGVKWWGEGAYERETIDGSRTAAKTLSLVRPDDLIINKIWVRHGSTAIATQAVDGCAASGEFPTFELNRDRVEPRWIHWQTKTRPFWDKCDVLSRGTSGKNRIKPERFLTIAIPLPPIEEQRWIVARIEALAAKIAEARRLRKDVRTSIEAFVASTHFHLADGREIRLGELLELYEDQVAVRIEGTYPQVGVRGFGGGLFAREVLTGDQTTYKRFNRLYAGAIVLSQVKGWEGAIAACSDELIGKFVSPEYRTFRCKPSEAIPEYMAVLVKTPWFWTQLKEITRGVGARRERTRPEQFLAMRIAMPIVSEQRRALDAYRLLEPTGNIHDATIAELDALLPSILDKAFKGELLPPRRATTAVVSSPVPTPERFTDLADLVVRAYFDVRDGWSTEYLVSSPALSQRFIERCAALGAERTPRDLLSALINARRASALKGSEKATKFSIPRKEMDLFSFASEMAFRCIQDRIQDEQQRELTVDAMLSNPALATEFDQFAARLAPGYEPLQYRWTAITLRKDRKFSDATRPSPLFEDLGRADDVRVGKIADDEGVYCVTVEQKPIFVAVADNLRTQIDRLLEGTRKRITPDWMNEEITGMPRLHVLSMPKCSVVEREITRARVLRDGFARLNFLGGPLFDKARPGR